MNSILFVPGVSNAVPDEIAILPIILLMILLAQKEIVRASNVVNTKQWMRALDIAIVPLTAVSTLIIVLRFADLIR